jgi:hypothetical protein
VIVSLRIHLALKLGMLSIRQLCDKLATYAGVVQTIIGNASAARRL